MSISFRFRSSVSSESVDCGGRPAVTVRDLRAMIAAKKKLPIGRQCDIIVVDPDTGIALKEDLEIKAGSNVIIKRVPVERPAASDLDAGKDVGRGGYKGKDMLPPRQQQPPSNNVDVEKLDDFGINLYPALHGSLPEPYADINNLTLTTKKDVMRRCSKASIPRHQNIQRSDREAMLKEVVGDNYCNEPDNLEIKTDIMSGVNKKLNEYVPMPSPELNIDLGREWRCSLCKEFLKEAVMMPCCHYSFCDKCVRLALNETGMCPSCSSVKCTINDLVPNLTVRGAVKRFLEAQAAENALYNNVSQYAPDVESGIHAKEVSSAVSTRQEEPPAAVLNGMTGPQGSNVASTLLHNVLQEEDRSGIFMQRSRHTNVGRNCYNCGSPDHLIRDCPVAFMPYTVNQTEDAAIAGDMAAYPQVYWHGASYAYPGPYASMYGAPGMMPFGQTMVPVSRYFISPYMASTYPVTPVSYEFMRMGGVQHPMMSGSELPYTRGGIYRSSG